MRTLNTIINNVIDVISAITDCELKVYTAFQSNLLDVPISKPTVTVGIDRAVFNTSSVSAYSGVWDGEDFYSVHGELDVSVNIYLPNKANGLVLFEVLSYIIFALERSALPVCKITSGSLKYDNTLMYSVLPVTVTLSDYLFKED